MGVWGGVCGWEPVGVEPKVRSLGRVGTECSGRATGRRRCIPAIPTSSGVPGGLTGSMPSRRIGRDAYVLPSGTSSPTQAARLGAMQYEAHQKALARHLESNNLKRTKQREEILEVFLDAGGHLTGEDLYQLIRKRAPRIGYTTVYRTLKLFVEAGLAEEHHFDDGVTRYEIEHKHHDHLVCILCGKILEFESKEIEQAQKLVAHDMGFTVLRHRHELYGHCSDCTASQQG